MHEHIGVGFGQLVLEEVAATYFELLAGDASRLLHNMSNRVASRVLSFTIALMTTLAAQAQAPRPSFEVASVKPVGFDGRVSMAPQPNGLSAWGITARMLIRNAYRVPEFQIEGGPAWISEDRFAVEAKAARVGPGELPLMIQSLLEERFKLKIHRETRELPVYALMRYLPLFSINSRNSSAVA